QKLRLKCSARPWIHSGLAWEGTRQLLKAWMPFEKIPVLTSGTAHTSKKMSLWIHGENPMFINAPETMVTMISYPWELTDRKAVKEKTPTSSVGNSPCRVGSSGRGHTCLQTAVLPSRWCRCRSTKAQRVVSAVVMSRNAAAPAKRPRSGAFGGDDRVLPSPSGLRESPAQLCVPGRR